MRLLSYPSGQRCVLHYPSRLPSLSSKWSHLKHILHFPSIVSSPFIPIQRFLPSLSSIDYSHKLFSYLLTTTLPETKLPPAIISPCFWHSNSYNSVLIPSISLVSFLFLRYAFSPSVASRAVTRMSPVSFHLPPWSLRANWLFFLLFLSILHLFSIR